MLTFSWRNKRTKLPPEDFETNHSKFEKEFRRWTPGHDTLRQTII